MSDSEIEQIKEVATGFDRSIDFKTIKKRFIRRYNNINKFIDDLDEGDRYYVSKFRVNLFRMIYLLIAMIQLRNGSRISEAVEAFLKFTSEESFNEKILVKIAKSESTKLNKKGKKYLTKVRYRKMVFPSSWLETTNNIKYLDGYAKFIPARQFCKRVLDYLSTNFNCNTHSLRYAFINYMLYDKKKEITLVAKFVGHSSVSQLVRYTQNIRADELFDEEI